VKIG